VQQLFQEDFKRPLSFQHVQ